MPWAKRFDILPFPSACRKTCRPAHFVLPMKDPFEVFARPTAVTTLRAGDSFHLRRIHGYPEWSRFCNWLTLDPRKLSIWEINTTRAITEIQRIIDH